MLIDQMVFPTAIDMRGFDRGTLEMGRDVERVQKQITRDLSSIRPPALDAVSLPIGANGVGDVGGQLDQVRNAVSQIGGQIRGAMSATSGPLNAFAADFAAKFDRLGPTLQKLAVRIDDAIKFPAFEARTEKFVAWVGRRFGQGGTQAGAAFQANAAAGLGTAPVAARPDGWLDRLKAAAVVKGKEWGSLLGRGVTYGLAAAVHVPPSMTTAFINARTRNARGHVTGMQSPPPRAANQARPAVGTTLATKSYDALTRAVQGALWAEAASWKVIQRLRNQDARDVQNAIGGWLNWKRVVNVVASFGSVAKATWKGITQLKSPKIAIDPRQSVVIRSIGSAAVDTASKVASMGQSFATAFGFFGYAYKLAGFFKSGTIAASGLNETLSKTDAVLGRASTGVKAYADDVSDRFGLVKQQTLDVAAGFGGIAKGLGGMGGKELEDFSKKFTGMAADLTSYANFKDIDEAGVALRAALTGNESDRLKSLGIIYNENAMEAYAFAHGITTSVEKMSEQEKLMLRVGILQDKFGKGQLNITGDLERTAGSSANAYRGLTGRIANLGAAVGTALMPAIDRGLSALNWLATSAMAGFESAKATFAGFVDQVGKGINFVTAVLMNPAAALQVVKLKATEVFSNIVEWLAVIPENFAQYSAYIGRNWSKMLTDLAVNTLTAAENIASNFGAVATAIGKFLSDPMAGFPAVDWTPLTAGFLSTAEKLPGMIRPVLTDLSKEIGEASKPIRDAYAKLQADAMKPAAAMEEAKGDALAGANAEQAAKGKKGKQEKDFAAAAEINSGEAYSSLVRGLYGMKGGADANGRKTVSLLEQINVKLGQQNQMARRPDPQPAVKPNGART